MNPREIMIMVWGTIALGATMLKRDIRCSLFGVLRAMVARQLFIAALGSLAWNAAVVYGLFRIGFWHLSFWWDTVVFVVIGTFALVWRMMEEEDYTNRFFVRAALTNLGIGVVLETFVSGRYTFGLLAEFLLVPWLALLGGMLAVAQPSEKHSKAVKPIPFLVSATGFAMLVRAIAGAIADKQNFLTIQTAQWLLLPFVLTTVFLPYLIALRAYILYETACIPLKLGRPKTWQIRAYARLRMFFEFGLNLSRLHRFQASDGNDLRWATTRREVDEVFERAT